MKNICEFCEGTGEVRVMEQVYPNEPHMADIGTEKCICQLSDNDDYDRDEEFLNENPELRSTGRPISEEEANTPY